jgi:hypothetical protein
LGVFLLRRPLPAVWLILGLIGSYACFGFTYWLSQQRSFCPSWALFCAVSPAAKWFNDRLGLVQGVLSSLYGICIAGIVYAAYQLAETTIWPVMAKQALNMPQIDYYLAISRGTLPAFLPAIWNARRASAIAVIWIMGLLGILMQVNSSLVGYAYTLQNVTTPMHTNHTIGGGFGFGFSQANPPGPLPGGITLAYPVFSSWANAISKEPLPANRDFIFDRQNISSIGAFSAKAIKLQKEVNCSAFPFDIYEEELNPVGFNYEYYLEIGTNLGDNVTVRLQPALAVWVDSTSKLTNTSAVTRLVFAAFNGSIEGGHQHSTPTMEENDYSGVSSLACDVNIELLEDVLCVDSCDEEPKANVTLSSLDYFRSLNGFDPDISTYPVWFAAVATTLGVNIYGMQPMFTPGPLLEVTDCPPEHSCPAYSLPVAWTTANSPTSTSWTQANITHFIDVATGSLATVLTQEWADSNELNHTLVSSLKLPRLDPKRAYSLLAPPLIALALVGILLVLNALMHSAAHVSDVSRGSVAEIIARSQTNDITTLAEDVRSGKMPISALETLKLRYGISIDGTEGLSAADKMSSFP